MPRSVRVAIGDRVKMRPILPAVEPGFQPGGECASIDLFSGCSQVVLARAESPGGRMPPSTAARMAAATKFAWQAATPGDTDSAANNNCANEREPHRGQFSARNPKPYAGKMAPG